MGRPDGGKTGRTQLGLWSFIAAIAALLVSAITLLDLGRSGFAGFLALPLHIAAIILGALGLREVRTNPRMTGRWMALTGLLVSSITLGLGVLFFLFCLIFFIFYYKGPTCIVPAAAVCATDRRLQDGPSLRALLRRGPIKPRLDALLAHHPPGPRFAHDVFHLDDGVRVCVGCATLVPTVSVAYAVLQMLPFGSWDLWMALGFAVGSAQFLSAAGWTRTQRRKILVKVCLGMGLAMIAHAVLASPWTLGERWVFVGAVAAIGSLVQVPRALRIRRMAAAPA